MKRNKLSKVQKRIKNLYQTITVVVFIVFLFIGGVTGSLWFFRPSTSIVEKRDLAPFPVFTMTSFLDGSYFSDVSTWYSDTYPMREQFISMNNTLKGFYGIEADTQMIGGGKGDEIPTNGEKKIQEEIKVPDTTYLNEEIQDRIMNGLYVENGAVYDIYYFGQSAADTYIDMLDKTAKKLKGVTNVYNLLVPNSAGVLLDDKLLEKVGGSHEGQAMDYYYNSYENVTGLDIFNTLREHRDEYLYFRTDHHWTSEAAYYTYLEYCRLKGFTPKEKDEFVKYEFYPFLGSYYTELQLKEMEENPDRVIAYGPTSTNDMTYDDVDGNTWEQEIIRDVSQSGVSSGYQCFVGGDLPFVEIDNPEIEDGSSVLVIKDSYANCFIPMLVDHYDRVFYMDFRYAPYSVEQFCIDNNVTDLIFENNLQMIGSLDVVAMIKSIL
ncbi:MAG: DHHW family protein [Bacillota bacterium]|nr:DHHW family protein [Bacillota bacterium]